jgi:hypothetical protein
VAQQRDRFAAIASGDARSGCQVLDAAAAASLWARHDALLRAGDFRAKAATAPAAFASTAAEILAPLFSALESPACVWYPTIGLGFVTGEARATAEVTEAVGGARTKLGRGGGSLVLHAAPDAVRAGAGVWGAPPASIVLMRSIKDRFDPTRSLAPGRFVGGI